MLERLLRRRDLLAHPLGRGAAIAGPASHRGVDAEDVIDAARRSARRSPAAPRAPARRARRRAPRPACTARPMTWCASRNGRPASRTSQSARSVAVAKPASAAARIRSTSKLRRLDHPGQRLERQHEQIVRLEDRRLVVLHVLRISERQALHRHRPGRPSPRRSGREWPRTSSAASGLRFCGMIDEPVECVGQDDEAERLARPDDQFLGEPRQMERALGRRHQIIEREVAVGHGVERIGGGPVEAERRRRSHRGRSGSWCRPAPPRRAGIR